MNLLKVTEDEDIYNCWEHIPVILENTQDLGTFSLQLKFSRSSPQSFKERKA